MVALFQFLGRNSGRSDDARKKADQKRKMGFNSSVGILVVRTYPIDDLVPAAGSFNSSVGILVVRTKSAGVGVYDLLAGFNSSVGILVVRTKFVAVVVSAEIVVSIPRSEFWSFGRDYQLNTITSSWLFQFLGRNSGRSDLLDNGAFEGEQVVSIPRSEFWSFGHTRCHPNVRYV